MNHEDKTHEFFDREGDFFMIVIGDEQDRKDLVDGYLEILSKNFPGEYVKIMEYTYQQFVDSFQGEPLPVDIRGPDECAVIIFDRHKPDDNPLAKVYKRNWNKTTPMA